MKPNDLIKKAAINMKLIKSIKYNSNPSEVEEKI